MTESFRQLKVWQKAIDLVTLVYQLTRTFPHEERFCLTQQVRRAAISVPGNIAEGVGRFSRKDERAFLIRARGSLLEVETQLEIACRLGYLREDSVAQAMIAAGEIGRMINGLVRHLTEADNTQ